MPEDGTSRDAPRVFHDGTGGRWSRRCAPCSGHRLQSATATPWSPVSPLGADAPVRVDRGDDVTVLKRPAIRNVWTTCWRTIANRPLHADAYEGPDWHTALVDGCAGRALPTC